MKKHQPSDSQLKIRLSSHELERFKSLAKKRGLSLTELVQLRIRNKPLPDRNREKESSLHHLLGLHRETCTEAV